MCSGARGVWVMSVQGISSGPTYIIESFRGAHFAATQRENGHQVKMLSALVLSVRQSPVATKRLIPVASVHGMPYARTQTHMHTRNVYQVFILINVKFRGNRRCILSPVWMMLAHRRYNDRAKRPTYDYHVSILTQGVIM